MLQNTSGKGYENLLALLAEKKVFRGESGESFTHVEPSGKTVVFLGLGEEAALTEESLRMAGFKAAKALSAAKVEKAHVVMEKISGLCYRKSTKAFAEGLLHAAYRFDKYLSKKSEFTVTEVSFKVLSGKEDKVLAGLEEVHSVMEGVFLARDLVNEPGIVLTAAVLAERAKEALSDVEVEVEILEKEDAERLGMKAYLAVNRGSTNPPKGIVMRYRGGAKEDPILGLVGKGVTYDTGGYSLKPGASMYSMYGDMGGAAVVVGAMKAIAMNGLKKNVTAVILATDNMVSGDAYMPGDIIGSMAGKTIEIHSTDAEGRLTLADAVYHIIKNEGAREVVDVATLTGACVVALGSLHTGAFTNHQELMDRVKEAAGIAGEPLWQMPLTKEYKELIKGDRGDLKNSGGRWGGAITAASFIEEFVEDTPWVHLDIAGTSDLEAARGYLPKGGTGTTVKTLYHLAKGEAPKRC